MHYKYGEYAQHQIASNKKKIRKKIFLLLLAVDPKTKNEFKNVDVNAAFNDLLYTLGGLNSLLLEPPELVNIMSLLESALIEYNSPEFSVEDFFHSKYRKLILDAGNEVEKIKEVD